MIGRFAAPAIIAAAVAISPAEAGRSLNQKLAPGLVESQRASQLASSVRKVVATEGALGEVGYAKDLMSTADPIAEAARQTFGSYDAAHAYAQSHRHLLIIAQHGKEAVRLEKELEMADMLVQNFKSPAARSASVFMQSYLAEARAGQHEARSMRHGYELIYSNYKNARESGVGRLALDVEKHMLKSSMGRGLLTGGKLLAKQGVQRGLVGVGGAVAAQEAYHSSTSERDEVKWGSAAMAGAMNVATDIGMGAKIAAGRFNPAVALYDPAVKLVSRLTGHEELGEKFTISKWIEGTAHVYGAYAEALWYGDTEPLSRLHQQNISGSNGIVLQTFATLGDKISQSGAIDVLVDTVDFVKKVPDSFKKAAAWWEAL